MTSTDVVGSTPISITGSSGGQRMVPLSALEFVGSSTQVRQAWAGAFTTAEALALRALADARVTGGELSKPPVPPPTPALVVTASVPGDESNTIAVHVTPDQTSTTPLTTAIAISVTEKDAYTGLRTPADAVTTIGVDQPPTAPDDPRLGSGLVQVKHGSAGSSIKLPVDVAPPVALTDAGLDIKDGDGAVLFTLLPRPGYAPTTGLTVQVTRDASGDSFTITAAYDSAKEAADLPTFTVQTLDTLPAQVTYVVTVTAPAGGAAVPAATRPGGVPLSGGGPGLAARALLYTPTT